MKEIKLLKLKDEMLVDKRLPLKGSLVFGDGLATSRVVFVGEAPGAKEEELGTPFVGRSGKLLDKALLTAGLSRTEVYITNIVKRRPVDNRDPNREELAAYRPYLDEELKIIKPLVVVSLGRFALNYFLEDKKISEVQGKIIKLKDFTLLPIFHPAAAFRRKACLEEFNKSFKVLEKILKKEK